MFLRQFLAFADTFAATIYVDGSFITQKLSPNDVDLIVVLPASFDFATEIARRLERYQRKGSSLHIFVYRRGRDETQLADLLEYFQLDRGGHLKGVVQVIAHR